MVAGLSVLLGVLVYYAYQIGLFAPDALPALREQLLELARGAGVLA